MGYIWFRTAFGTKRGSPPVRCAVLGRLDGYAHEKEQRLRELRIMSGSSSHGMIPIDVDLPLAGEMIGIWTKVNR